MNNNNQITTKDNIFQKTLQFRQEIYKQNEELKQLMNETNKKQNEYNFNKFKNEDYLLNQSYNNIDNYINNL